MIIGKYDVKCSCAEDTKNIVKLFKFKSIKNYKYDSAKFTSPHLTLSRLNQICICGIWYMFNNEIFIQIVTSQFHFAQHHMQKVKIVRQ